MNKEHVKILIWEQSRNTLKLVIPITLVFACIDIGYQFLEHLLIQAQLMQSVGIDSPEAAETLPITPLVEDSLISIVYTGALVNILLLMTANTSSSNLLFGMGKYYLRLPVNTWVLAGTRILYNCFALLVTTWFLLWVHYKTILIPEEQVSFWLVSLTVLLCYLPIQLVAWSFGTRTAIVGILGISGYLVYDLINFNTALSVTFVNAIPIMELYSSIATHALRVLVAAVFTILLAGFSLRYQRFHEQIPVYALFVSIVDNAVHYLKERKNKQLPRFTSPQHAQAWIEKRYMMNLFQSSFLGFFFILAVIMTFEEFKMDILVDGFLNNQARGDLASLLPALLEGSLYIILFTAGFSGLISGIINYRRQTTSLSAFTYTKPISTDSLARIRLTSVFRSMFIPLMIMQLILAALVILIIIEGNYNGPLDNIVSDSPIILLLLFYFVYLGLIAATWCLRWSITTLPMGVYFGYIFALALILLERYPVPAGIVYLAIGVGILPALIVWVQAIWKYNVPAQSLLFFPIVFMSLYVLVFTASDLTFQLDDQILIQVLCITVAAYMPFATVPMAIDLTRHR